MTKTCHEKELPEAEGEDRVPEMLTGVRSISSAQTSPEENLSSVAAGQFQRNTGLGPWPFADVECMRGLQVDFRGSRHPEE